MAAAVPRPTRRCVSVKSGAPQALQARHRGQERRMKARPALLNATRGLRHDYGMIGPPGASPWRQQVLAKLAPEDPKRTPQSLALFRQLREELAALAARVAPDETPLAQVAQTHPVCQRLVTIPGLGALPATAWVAAVSDTAQCNNGRQCAACLGLVPRHHRTGGKTPLLGLSKHGESYLRKLLRHGARSCLRWGGRKRDRRSQWGRSLLERRGWNRAAVALANKNARVAWVLMGPEQVYKAAQA